MRQAVAGAEVTSNIPGESPRGRGNPTPLLDAGRITGPARKYDLATLPACFPMAFLWELERYNKSCKLLILLVGAPRFELGTPSPPDWCANRAALRSDGRRTIVSGGRSNRQEAAGCASKAAR